MSTPTAEINIDRRKFLFKIMRLVTSKLITGNYQHAVVAEISADELNAHMQSERAPIILDTRSAAEFHSGFGHIPGSIHFPLMELAVKLPSLDQFKTKISELEGQLDEFMAYTDHEVVTICPGGGFSLVAAEMMAEAGFKDVKSLDGGIDNWYLKDYPTTVE